MTPAEFKTRFPEFKDELPARIELVIADADPLFNVERWGGFYELGLAYWTAHEIYTGNQRAAGGVVTANNVTVKKVDMVQVSRDAGMLAAEAREPYMSTAYGQKYLYYRDLIGNGALAV